MLDAHAEFLESSDEYPYVDPTVLEAKRPECERQAFNQVQHGLEKAYIAKVREVHQPPLNSLQGPASRIVRECEKAEIFEIVTNLDHLVIDELNLRKEEVAVIALGISETMIVLSHEFQEGVVFIQWLDQLEA